MFTTPKLVMLSALLFTFVATSANAQKSAASLNQQGFELLKKGKHAEAQAAFEKALEKESSHPFAHLNMARVLFRTAKSKDPESLFECVAELTEEPSATGYNILWHLSRSAESKTAEVNQKLRDEDPWLKEFRKTGIYQRWILSIQKFPVGQDLKSFLTKSEWWAYSNSGDSWNVVFQFDQNGRIWKSGPDGKRTQFGTWELGKGQEVLITPANRSQANGSKRKYSLSQIRTAFGQKGRYFFNLGLNLPGSSMPEFVLGPRVGDCGETNY
jgi:hypothetical protein